MKDEYRRIKLHVLSPLNIGCDDVYEPTGFVIDQDKNILREFDPMDFVEKLPPQKRQEFIKVCSSDNPLPILKFIKHNYVKVDSEREIGIAPELSKHYQKVLSMSSFNKDAVINQFTMYRTAFNPQTNRPYIPGSSLKGSMRTAYLSALAGAGKYDQLSQYLSGTERLPVAISNFSGRSSDLEKDLLKGTFAEDPFSVIKISDLLPTETVQTRILYAVNKKKKPNDVESKAQSGPPQIIETAVPGCSFEGTMKLLSDVTRIKEPLDMSSLLLSVNKHYARVFNQEVKVSNNVKFKMPQLGAFKDAQKKTVFLVRLGRHSGAEAVTIEGNRKIKIMRGPKRNAETKNEATTIWLAANDRKGDISTMMPFGWAVLEVIG